MPAFEYKALDNKGKQKKGVMEADTARHARGLGGQRPPRKNSQHF